MEVEKQVVEAESPSPPPETTDEYVEPRGAFAFIILMFIFYVGYWIFSWVEVFVLRSVF
jgi:hypothetical protein